MDKNTQYVDNILQKFKIFFGFKNDKELSNIFNISTQRMGNWKYRSSLDYNVIISFCEKNNIDLNSVFYEDSLKIVSKKTDSIVLSSISKEIKDAAKDQASIISQNHIELTESLARIEVSNKIDRAKGKVPLKEKKVDN